MNEKHCGWTPEDTAIIVRNVCKSNDGAVNAKSLAIWGRNMLVPDERAYETMLVRTRMNLRGSP